MSLEIQILLVIISFLFGIFFEFIHTISYKIIYCKKIFIRVIFTFILIFLQSLLYFYVLLKVNNGIIHIYGIISLLVGMISFYYMKLLFYKKRKK